MSKSAADASPEAIPELIEVGQLLRRAREERGISIAELAGRLHLAPEQLSALESGNRTHLREPVFVIAQAKRIAQSLGIDIKEAIERLRHSRLVQSSSVLAQPPQAAAAAANPPRANPAGAVGDPQQRRGPFPARLATAITALALLGVGVAQAIRHWSQPRTASGPPPAATEAARPEASSPRAPSISRGSPGVLHLRSDEPSWVEVRQRNGAVLFRGILGDEARFRLGEGLEVLAGRPDLVTVSIGGKGPRRLGRISEIRWRSIRPSP